MQDRLESLASKAREEIGRAKDASGLEALRVRYLGKKGELSAVLGGMGKLPPDERRRVESYGLNLSVSVDHFRHHVAGGRFPTLGGAGSELAVAIRDELEYAIGFLVAARSVFSKL